jgi:SnoaL-like domain
LVSEITASYVEILNLIYRYPELVDAGDFAGIGDMFEHGTLVFEAPDGSVAGEAVGRAAVQATYEQSTRRYPDDGTPHTRHLITNPIVEIDEAAGTATCRYYITVFQRTDEFPLAPIWSNRYEDHLRRVRGRWWIERRRDFAHLPGDTSQHLLQSPGF